MKEQEIIIEIKGNKYTEKEVDEILTDFINIGENVYKRRKKVVETLLKDFNDKYKKMGMFIINKKRNLKQILNSAKSIYRLAEFYLCNETLNEYDKYVYVLNKNIKGPKVYLHIKDSKELVLIYDSISIFLENWLIYRNIGGVKAGK